MTASSQPGSPSGVPSASATAAIGAPSTGSHGPIRPVATPIARRVFRFEADFAGDLRCLPMAVRRKLDLVGVKLKLAHWHALASDERQGLLDWDDSPEALEALAVWLLERTATTPAGVAATMPLPAASSPWLQAAVWPEPVQRACAQLSLAIRAEGWSELDDLQRFALVKLSHPGHEHRNLPAALLEFDMLQRGSAAAACSER